MAKALEQWYGLKGVLITVLCHNPQTHDFNGGYVVELDDIFKEMNKLRGQDGITLSGGDPMVQPLQCLEIAKYAHKLGLNVWCYTGYLYENILKKRKKKSTIGRSGCFSRW